MKKELPLKIKSFIKSNSVAHIATLTQNSKPNLATIYYVFKDDHLYFLTRSESKRVKNILKNNNVALLINDIPALITLQLECKAKIIDSEKDKNNILEAYSSAANEASQETFPPVIKTYGTSFKIIKCSINWFRYSNFSGPKQFRMEGKV